MNISEEKSELFKALAEFQKEAKQPKKDANNPFFKSKYVPLENVVDVIHETASKHGLSEITYPSYKENEVGVGVIITHSSGQYIELPPIYLKPEKNTPQGIGATLTYGRRYALSAAFGIASETDDDGNSISGNQNNQSKSNKPKQKPKAQTIDESQKQQLRNLISEYAKVTGNTDGSSIEKLNNWALGQVKAETFGRITVSSFKQLEGKLQTMIQNKKSNEQDSLFKGNSTKPKEDK